MYNFITNPKTNKVVSIKGRVGRAILKNYLKQLQKGGN